MAQILLEAFKRAMHSTNPRLNIGMSQQGPAALFIVQVVPHITGETEPTVAAVSQYLKRVAKVTGTSRR